MNVGELVGLSNLEWNIRECLNNRCNHGDEAANSHSDSPAKVIGSGLDPGSQISIALKEGHCGG